MDLSSIDNIKELKALAYDQLVIRQNAEINLNAINARIEQIEQESKKIEKK